MTPKEEARELVDKFKDKFFMEPPEVKEIKSKQCALICVDEKMNEVYIFDIDFDDKHRKSFERFLHKKEDRCQKVKQEIEKL